MATYTRTYTWPQRSGTILTPYSAHQSSWTWGTKTFSASQAGLATRTGIGEYWGSYCQVSGDTTHYATKVTALSCSCYFDNANDAGSWIGYYVVGNNGNDSVTIVSTGDQDTWVKKTRYTKTKSGLALSGSFLNNGIYGFVVACSAHGQQVNLGSGYASLTITFEGINPAKYYYNNQWRDCTVYYYTGATTGWKEVIPSYYYNSKWNES